MTLPPTTESNAVKGSTFTILLGRHKEAFSHEGNKKFRAIVKTHAAKYNQAKGRHEKSQITSFLLAELEQQGAIFLQKNPETKSWEKMPRRTVVAKIGHAIRDATVRYCRKQEKGKKKKNTAPKPQLPPPTKLTPPMPTVSSSLISHSSSSSSVPELQDSFDTLFESFLTTSESESATSDISTTTESNCSLELPGSSELMSLEVMEPELVTSDPLLPPHKECDYLSMPKLVTFPPEGDADITPVEPLIDLPISACDWDISDMPSTSGDLGLLADFPATSENWNLFSIPPEEMVISYGEFDLISLR